MSDELTSLFELIPGTPDSLTSARDILLANAIMFGEIPAPSFGEEGRIRFLSDRFTEAGLVDISTDEVGNCLARLPGKVKKKPRNILLNAHADTVFPASFDHAMAVNPDKIIGPSIANNSLGLAFIAVLPTILEKLGIKLNSTLYLLGSTRSLGRGNLEGINFFTQHFKDPIHQAISVEAVHAGRLSYSSLGMLRAEISVQVPEETAWHHFGRISAVRVLNKILNRLYTIPIPREPKTSINIGMLSSGNTFSDMTTSGAIRLEVRSEEASEVARIHGIIDDIVEETSLENRFPVKMEIIAQRAPGGIPFSHPLVATTRQIMNHLDLEPTMAPSVGELSALIAQGIPAITLGLTTGEHMNTMEEAVFIEPLQKGIAQLLYLILASDQGLCDENN